MDELIRSPPGRDGPKSQDPGEDDPLTLPGRAVHPGSPQIPNKSMFSTSICFDLRDQPNLVHRHPILSNAQMSGGVGN
eukprot:4046579-Amphidinium_carterae.1